MLSNKTISDAVYNNDPVALREVVVDLTDQLMDAYAELGTVADIWVNASNKIRESDYGNEVKGLELAVSLMLHDTVVKVAGILEADSDNLIGMQILSRLEERKASVREKVLSDLQSF